MNKLGDYLRRRRGSLSLRDFAKQCGISHTHLDSLEKGFDPRTGKPVRVTTDTLKNIADGLGVDYLYLSGLAENIDVSSPSSAWTDAQWEQYNHALSEEEKADYLRRWGVPDKLRGRLPELEDSELWSYLEELKNRPEMRMLFKCAADATKEDVEKAVKIIEALQN